jgi:hypothetical protein
MAERNVRRDATRLQGLKRRLAPIARIGQHVTRVTEARDDLINFHKANGRDTKKLEGRIAKHLTPFFSRVKMQWRQVDLKADEVRLEPGTTKNNEGRTYPFTKDLRALIEAQHAEHERLKKKGQIVPWVFFRMVALGRGGPLRPKPIKTFVKAFKSACRKAGYPGRIPHDMRRSAVRNLERAGVPRSVP